MFAGCRVQARVGEAKPLDRFAAQDVRVYDLVYIGLCDVSVPNCFGINHDVRPVLALVEATGLIGAYSALQPAFGKLLLEEFLQPSFRSWIAASSRVARRTLVSADKDMLFEFGHQDMHSRTLSSVLTRFYRGAAIM
jgi:hypothetical protein